MFRSMESNASPDPPESPTTESGTDATDPVRRLAGYVGSKAPSSSSSSSLSAQKMARFGKMKHFSVRIELVSLIMELSNEPQDRPKRASCCVIAQALKNSHFGANLLPIL